MPNPPAAGWRIWPMAVVDHDRVPVLRRKSQGVGLGESDDRAAIADYLHHLAVSSSHRRQSIGRALVDEYPARLKRLSLPHCNLFLYAHNQTGRTL